MISAAPARGFAMIQGGELEQIQFLLGHVSVQTTEKYLGYKQRLRHAVNDRLGIGPDAPIPTETLEGLFTLSPHFDQQQSGEKANAQES